jgi:hypothetical protein
MFIAVLKIRQVQGSAFFALGHVFSPPHVVDYPFARYPVRTSVVVD